MGEKQKKKQPANDLMKQPTKAWTERKEDRIYLELKNRSS